MTKTANIADRPKAAPSVQPDGPPLLTATETIAYLRLDADERDPAERLRNLIRRQRLPCIRRGRLLLFRRAAVDAWLDTGGRTVSPARLVGSNGLRATNGVARNGRVTHRSK